MDKVQIESEIRRYKTYIRRSQEKIDDYNAKIRGLERDYDRITTAANRMQDCIEAYGQSVRSAFNRLDRDSTFRDFYNEKTKMVLNGRERHELFDEFNRGKKMILREIDEFENVVVYERRKITDYNNKITRLKQQLTML